MSKACRDIDFGMILSKANSNGLTILSADAEQFDKVYIFKVIRDVSHLLQQVHHLANGLPVVGAASQSV